MLNCICCTLFRNVLNLNTNQSTTQCTWESSLKPCLHVLSKRPDGAQNKTVTRDCKTRDCIENYLTKCHKFTSSSKPTRSYMANNDMFHLCYRNTRHVSVHWKELGALLNVEKHCLDEIDRDNPRDVVSCRMDMLSAWLRSKSHWPCSRARCCFGWPSTQSPR